MARMQRLLANLLGGWFQLRRRFPPALLDDMAAAIAAGERAHLGEVCFAVESRLAPLAVLDGIDASKRAHQVFAQLRVWNTEHNSGVLFYVLMAERRIEIVADRGIASRVQPDEWNAISRRMLDCYARGQWREGSLDGIAATHALLLRHFPDDGTDRRDELPDRPVLL
ncbi:TPM domain-containing protein [Rhodanobacter sp. L36]|uniref:TPM domain-containing protein n=1 Tax=Rhodanobacter sp. L36 TaxID=1747221 RepID=UPI00131E87A3|nr:TPM domain-containing protein [Rhodanobacter sp. L36]